MKDQVSIERRFADKLENIIDAVPWLRGGVNVSYPPVGADLDYDFKLKLSLPGSSNGKQSIKLLVECKNQPRPSQFVHVARYNRFADDGGRHTTAHVLAAPYISPRIAEICKEHGWGWFDLAGNCCLSFPNLLHIEKTGLKTEISIPRPKANLSTDASARVLRALLSSGFAEKAWTQTALKKACEPSVSIGLVNKVSHYLLDQAWLELDPDGKLVVKDALHLLKAWAEKYKFERHTRVNYFTLLKPEELRQELALLSNIEVNDPSKKVAYAAFSAADYHAPAVKQHKTWLYVNKQALNDFIELSCAKQVDKGENIVLLIPSDDGVFYDRQFRQGLDVSTTSPVQTWLDLQQVGSRGEEAAEAIMHQCIEPTWGESTH